MRSNWCIRPACPLLQAYFIGYFGSKFSDADARVHLGDIAIWRMCGLCSRAVTSRHS